MSRFWEWIDNLGEDTSKRYWGQLGSGVVGLLVFTAGLLMLWLVVAVCDWLQLNA